MKEGRRCKNKKQMLWNKQGEKPSKFFLNLKKRRGIQDQIRKPIVNNQKITHQNKIHDELLFFYQTLFINTSANTSEILRKFSERSSCSQIKL